MMSKETGTARVKRGMAEMLKGGVIMDVVNVEQAKIAEDAGAVAVMALERVPADIRALRYKLPFLFQLWQKRELVILLKHKFYKHSVLITSMSQKF
jgi:hypothetical protein